MRVPTVGSKVVVRTSYPQGAVMIPPQPTIQEFTGTVLNPYKWLNDRQFCLSGDKDWPIRVMDMNSVEDIKLLSGKMKTIDLDTKVWNVSGSKGNKYVVTRNASKWSCTCQGFQFRKQCKHISELSGVKQK